MTLYKTANADALDPGKFDFSDKCRSRVMTCALLTTRPALRRAGALIVIQAAILFFAAVGTASGQSAAVVNVTETFNWSTPSPDPSGVVFVPGAHALFIADSEVEETPLFRGSNLFQTELDGSLVNLFSTISFTPEPAGITVNPTNGHLFFATDNSPRRVFELNPGVDGIYQSADDILTSFKTRDFGSSDAEGITYDPSSGRLYLVDGATNLVYTVDPGTNQIFDGVAPAGDDIVSSFDTSSLGVFDPEGIAFDNVTGHLYVIGKPRDQLLQVSTSGQFVRTITLDSQLLRKPAGLSMGPSSLNNGSQSLYLVDRGIDNDYDPTENDGRLFEFALPPLPGNQAPTVYIAAPTDRQSFQIGELINFAGTAFDLEDGDLTTQIAWKSDIDGAIGSGAGFMSANLSPGLHTITASTIDSSSAQALDVIQLRVISAGTFVVETRIASSSDDSEQRGIGGNTWTNSNDLELVDDNGVEQIVGLRFNSLSIPAGSIIEEAYIQFQAHKAQTEPLTLEIRAQASDNAEPIVGRKNNLTNRSTTAASSIWQPAGWYTVGAAGVDQKSSDLTSVVQEVIDRSGWSSGGSMLFMITGSGPARRTAEVFDSNPSAASLLYVRYRESANASNLGIKAAVKGKSFANGSTINLDGASRDVPDGELRESMSAPTIFIANPMAGSRIDNQTPVQVNGAVDSNVTLRVRVDSGTDDAEERNSGNVSLSGSDLELTNDGPQFQTVGMRFNAVEIPKDAGIVSAVIQFHVDESDEEFAWLEISAQDSVDPTTFSNTRYDISSRARTADSVSWMPPPWSDPGSAGPDQQTPDLSTLVQNIVTRDNWTAGNSLAFIVEGDGRRVATSYESRKISAPELIVTYTMQNQAPIVSTGPDQQIDVSDTLVLNGSVSDDGQPSVSETLELQWSVSHGLGSVAFSDPTSLATTVSLDAVGTYELFLSAHDGQLSAFDALTVTVNPSANNAPPVVTAGADLLAPISEVVTLSASVTDDGIPGQGVPIIVDWSQLSGPASAQIDSTDTATTNVVFPEAGTYVLEISAFDGELMAMDQITFTVSENNGSATVVRQISHEH